MQIVGPVGQRASYTGFSNTRSQLKDMTALAAFGPVTHVTSIPPHQLIDSIEYLGYFRFVMDSLICDPIFERDFIAFSIAR